MTERTVKNFPSDMYINNAPTTCGTTPIVTSVVATLKVATNVPFLAQLLLLLLLGVTRTVTVVLAAKTAIVMGAGGSCLLFRYVLTNSSCQAFL